MSSTSAAPVGTFFDRETGTRWSIEGKAEAGPLMGKALGRIDSHMSQWYGWVAYFPESAYYGPQLKAENLKMTLSAEDHERIARQAREMAAMATKLKPTEEQRRRMDELRAELQRESAKMGEQFQAQNRDQIEKIVSLELEKVIREVKAQDMFLEVTEDALYADLKEHEGTAGAPVVPTTTNPGRTNLLKLPSVYSRLVIWVLRPKPISPSSSALIPISHQ